jgi:hypothetical protein
MRSGETGGPAMLGGAMPVAPSYDFRALPKPIY